MAIVRNILVRVGADVNPLQQGMTRAQQTLNRFSGAANNSMSSVNRGTSVMTGALRSVAGVVAAAFAVGALVNFGKGAIELASNLNEVQNVVDVTFGSMSKQINDFSQNALSKFGMSELSAKKFTSTIGAMLKSSGISGDGLVKMSEGITGLAGDMASFYNLSQEDAFAKIRSGISGETEPLKQLGVNMSVANMEAYALSQGIKTSYQSMDQAHQSLLRYNYLLSVTKDAQGDFARTSTSWANQTRLLSEEWKIFQGTMGQGFINILTPVLQGLNALIARLQTAANYFTAFTTLIFGSAQANATSITATNSAAAATDKLGASTKKTAAAIKGSLAGFDEINALSDNASSSMGDAADAAGNMGDINPGGHVTTPDVSGIISSLKPLKDALDSFMKPLQAIDFGPIVAAFAKLKVAMAPFVSTLFDGLKWAYFNIFVPMASWTISQLLPAFLDVLSGAFNVLNPLLETFKPFGLFLWNDFLSPLASFTGGLIITILKDLAAGLDTVGTWIKNNQEPVRIITGLVVGFFAAWKIIEVMAFIQMSGGIVTAFGLITDAIKAGTIAKAADKLETIALTAMYAVDFVVGIGKATAAMVVNAAETLYLKALMGVDLVKAIVASGVALVEQIVQWGLSTAAMIVNKIEMIATTIVQVAMTVATVAWNIAAGIGTVVTTAFGIAIAILTSPITLVVLAITALIAIGVLLYKNWDTIKEVAGTTFNSMKTVIGGVCTDIGTFFKNMVNGAIDGINALIRAINSIKLPEMTIPGIGKIGGGGLNMPQIPKLKNGGIVDSPTLAMIGESGKEAVVPLENTSFVDKLAGSLGTAVMAAMQFGNQNNNKQGDIVLQIDGVTFARVTNPYNSKETTRIGASMITAS